MPLKDLSPFLVRQNRKHADARKQSWPKLRPLQQPGGPFCAKSIESQALAVVKVLCVLHGQAANRPFLNMQDRIVDGL